MKTVLDFWAPSCAPCRAYKPRFEAFAKNNPDKAKFILVNINDKDNAKLVKKMKLSSIPTVVVLDGFTEIKRWVGAPKESDLLNAIT